MGANEFWNWKLPADVGSEFRAGDLLHVDPDKEPKPGGYVVAEFYGKPSLLQVIRGKKGTLRLKSPGDRSSIDAKHFKIVGGVTQLCREVLSPYTSKTA